MANSAQAIQSKGGDKIAYQRCTVAGADITPSDSWHDFPFQAKLKHSFTQPEKGITDRSGSQVATEIDDFTSDVIVTSLQDDAALEKFLKDDVPGLYFRIFSNNGKGASGKTKERAYAITKMERTYSSEEPGRRPEIKIIPIQNKTAVTFTGVPTWAKCAASDCVIAIDAYYIPVETT